ncbi:methyl-CpG-binding protein 2-like isoform X2 [Homarus americanus]|uniref:Methyl-CpG-binding domain protein 4-like 1 n=1 Tax=Homarus americanus TaxID=6706 RepID=A0A8J5MKP0_HOMAM|nr:methyl-CpG-binding protein 2-like isoform X2 [Homarus americanus]KAG7154969.1 methyl-CpG-binding domain protein 4-like 1 [Homarus americanus]
MPDTGEVPTPDGWSRVVVQRTTGATAGKFDVYYFSPIGKKLRSRNEVRTHCERNNLEVDMSLIFFSQRTSTTGVRIARSGTTTPKTASPKTTKSAKVPKAQKTPKSPKTPKSETTRKRKVASKTEGFSDPVLDDFPVEEDGNSLLETSTESISGWIRELDFSVW